MDGLVIIKIASAVLVVKRPKMTNQFRVLIAVVSIFLIVSSCSLFNQTRTLTVSGFIRQNGTNINFANFRTKQIFLELTRAISSSSSAILKNDSTTYATYSLTVTIDSSTSDKKSFNMNARVKTYFKDAITGHDITNASGELCYEMFVKTNSNTEFSVDFSRDTEPVSRTVNFEVLYFSYSLGSVPTNAIPYYTDN